MSVSLLCSYQRTEIVSYGVYCHMPQGESDNIDARSCEMKRESEDLVTFMMGQLTKITLVK